MRYRKLLVGLSHAFELATDSTDLSAVSPRGWLIHHSFAEMYNLRAIAGLLVRRPVATDAPDVARAGPPFQMPYTLNLPSTEANRWRLHRDILDAADRLYGQLRALLGPGSDGGDYLAAAAQLDQAQRRQVDQFINAPRAADGRPLP